MILDSHVTFMIQWSQGRWSNMGSLFPYKSTMFSGTTLWTHDLLRIGHLCNLHIYKYFCKKKEQCFIVFGISKIRWQWSSESEVHKRSSKKDTHSHFLSNHKAIRHKRGKRWPLRTPPTPTQISNQPVLPKEFPISVNGNIIFPNVEAPNPGITLIHLFPESNINRTATTSSSTSLIHFESSNFSVSNIQL